uniref:CDP-alcohol phosphatidyltransferase C-terminal domain-containing protein n=1 Tax=Chromera velia CCMP2878 TaxID=1169474 RepID=A0A0G4GH42_9ALVE|eukprot:Cvel_21896.t1-p1 / transcript=Cvel_21896.t1 / gene=Cvel_21896 / organism=Chromera_velia_CCMP2878 / gene_product=hypothetical protein / transcript_product=hypothetical protein / location=Cvel_scaffold2097:2085-2735(-) / protein_length=182 / sequence_SO=supercontig / SO=protein_coding / is_pseudo=false
MFSFALDWLDGAAARALNECSEFGSILDITVDNMARHMLWMRVEPKVLGPLFILVEWLTFAATSSERDGWKQKSFASSPAFLRAIMANHFRSPLGLVAISGLMFLPAWFYIRSASSLPSGDALDECFSSSAGCVLLYFVRHSGVGLALGCGRGLCLICELYLIGRWLEGVLQRDLNHLRRSR